MKKLITELEKEGYKTRFSIAELIDDHYDNEIETVLELELEYKNDNADYIYIEIQVAATYAPSEESGVIEPNGTIDDLTVINAYYQGYDGAEIFATVQEIKDNQNELNTIIKNK